MQTAKEENAQRRLVGRPTGEVLIDMGLLTQEQVDQATAEQQVSHQRIGEIALSKGWVTKGDLMQALARRLGCKYLDLAITKIDPVALELISERDARRYSAVPISFVDEHTVLVAMADPSNIVAIDDLRILTGFDIEPGLASNEEIVEALSKLRAVGGQLSEKIDTKVTTAEEEAPVDDMRDIGEQVEAAPVVKLVNGVLARAADEGASDIHL